MLRVITPANCKFKYILLLNIACFPVFKSAIAHKNFLEVCYVFLNTLVAPIRKENYASSFALKSDNKASFANRSVNLTSL